MERMGHGPWADRWANDRAYGRYGKVVTGSGVKGQAYGPFLHDGSVIGFLALGTKSEAHADHLLTDLPAIAEFAATASLLLTPLIVAQRKNADDRRMIEEIIAEAAYRPVFQPVVELWTGKTVGFEALTRFADGRMPDVVFGAAAQAGLGFELELKTLEASIGAARDLPAGAWLGLNVSPGLVVESAGLSAVLAARDRPVVLEITEHVAIDDYGAVRSAIDRLGPDLRVAVDDAGAGIANFSHLVELKPRLVKIDAGLIRDLDSDLTRQAVVVGLVHFGLKAGCEVIAEGIESEAELATAKALGVTHGQGYLIRRPAPVEDFAKPAPSVPVLPVDRPPRKRTPRPKPVVGMPLATDSLAGIAGASGPVDPDQTSTLPTVAIDG
jgi:EAL domain-containing protein (putative c-di-GMP-specific phosphodiesterase class I)